MRKFWKSTAIEYSRVDHITCQCVVVQGVNVAIGSDYTSGRRLKTMFKKFCILLFVMAVSICLGATAGNAAPVIFADTLGTSYTGSYSPIGTSIPGGYPTAWAGVFSATSTGSVTEIDLEIAKRYADGNGYSGAFTVEVWGSSSNLPTNKIYSSTEQTASVVYPNSISGYNPMAALQTISVSGLNLTAGNSYLLVVSASNPYSDVVWYTSTPGTTDRLLSGTWSVYSTSAYAPAFKISGDTSPVPIPAAVWLLGSGLTGLIGIRRFRK
jgi:hypothetical protein